MRAREFTIKEDDLDQFLQTKGLAPKSSKPTSDAQQFADAASRAWTMNFERPAKARVQAAKRAPTATKYASNL
jgi:hypothetical protein